MNVTVYLSNYLTKAIFCLAVAICASASASAQQGSAAAVGRIFDGDRATCSAVLIEADLLVTAAHCVSGIVKDPGRYLFRSGAYPGVPSYDFGISHAAMHPLYELNLQSDLSRIRFDLGLIRLSAPVDESILVPLPLADAPPSQPAFILASYRHGQGVRARERRCNKLEESQDVLFLACDVRSGESGAPVLFRESDVLGVGGIVSSRSQTKQQPIAIAVKVLPRLDPVMDVLRAVERTRQEQVSQ